MSEGCVNLRELTELCKRTKLCELTGLYELLTTNDHILLSSLYCTCLEMQGRDGEKIPLNLQDCLQSEFAAKQGSY